WSGATKRANTSSVFGCVMSPVCTTRSTPARFNSSTIRATLPRWLCVSLMTPMRKTTLRHLLEDVDAARAAEPDHVSEPDLRLRHVTLARLATQMCGHLVDVGDTGRAEGMTFREQAARNVHRDPSAERRLTLVDELPGLAVLAKPEVLVVQDLRG